MEGLTQASHKLAEEVYKQTAQKQQGQQQGAGPGSREAQQEQGHEGPQPKGKDDVIDAEFKEEDGK
jgi:molecular chaperone DnaK